MLRVKKRLQYNKKWKQCKRLANQLSKNNERSRYSTSDSEEMQTMQDRRPNYRNQEKNYSLEDTDNHENDTGYPAAGLVSDNAAIDIDLLASVVHSDNAAIDNDLLASVVHSDNAAIVDIDIPAELHSDDYNSDFDLPSQLDSDDDLSELQR